jgi:putative Ig domain-containing protein
MEWPRTVVTTALPIAQAGVAYSAKLSAIGGQPPYKWTVSGALPDGLQLEAQTGQLSGVPQVVGTGSGARISPQPVGPNSRSVTISVSDSAYPASTATRSVTIVVDGRATIEQ